MVFAAGEESARAPTQIGLECRHTKTFLAPRRAIYIQPRLPPRTFSPATAISISRSSPDLFVQPQPAILELRWMSGHHRPSEGVATAARSLRRQGPNFPMKTTLIRLADFTESSNTTRQREGGLRRSNCEASTLADHVEDCPGGGSSYVR